MRQKVIIVMVLQFYSISGCRYHSLSLSTSHRCYKSRSQSHPISVSICVLLPIMLNPKIYDPWTLAKPQSFKNSKHIISCQWQIDQQMDGKMCRCVQEEYTLWAPTVRVRVTSTWPSVRLPRTAAHCSSLQYWSGRLSSLQHCSAGPGPNWANKTQLPSSPANTIHTLIPENINIIISQTGSLISDEKAILVTMNLP